MNGGGSGGAGGAGASMTSPPPPPAPAPSPAPQPLLTKDSGNAVTSAAADVLDKAALPFQNLGNPSVSAFDKAQSVVASVAGVPGMLTSFLDDAFARATNGISKALPSWPAATIGGMVVGTPHTHTHPPSLIPPGPPIPLPAIGIVMTGCPSVLINDVPAARLGDFGLAPTCGAFTPVFEIVTGSSKVFIGGARAARKGIDFTRQCTPAPPSGGAAAGALSGVSKAMAVGSAVLTKAAQVSQLLDRIGAVKKVVTTQYDAAVASAGAAKEQGQADAAAAAANAQTTAAEASGALLAAGMMAANAAMEAGKEAMAALMGKDPGTPPCTGMILSGHANVIIGGFPMPSWSTVASGLKKLMGALANGAAGGAAQGKLFCFTCM